MTRTSVDPRVLDQELAAFKSKDPDEGEKAAFEAILPMHDSATKTRAMTIVRILQNVETKRCRIVGRLRNKYKPVLNGYLLPQITLSEDFGFCIVDYSTGEAVPKHIEFDFTGQQDKVGRFREVFEKAKNTNQQLIK